MQYIRTCTCRYNTVEDNCGWENTTNVIRTKSTSQIKQRAEYSDGGLQLGSYLTVLSLQFDFEVVLLFL